MPWERPQQRVTETKPELEMGTRSQRLRTLPGKDYDRTHKRLLENAHYSKSNGKEICWDCNSHDGCHIKDCKQVRGKMRQTGIQWGVLMQLARRGGMSGITWEG